jgi:hypothetical protein
MEATDAETGEPRDVQLHLVLPYKIEPRRDRQVRAYLERGFRIVDVLRLTDREALITVTNRPWGD